MLLPSSFFGGHKDIFWQPSRGLIEQFYSSYARSLYVPFLGSHIFRIISSAHLAMKNVLLAKIAAAAEAAVAANEAKVQSIFVEASLFKWPEL